VASGVTDAAVQILIERKLTALQARERCAHLAARCRGTRSSSIGQEA
jgi:hypothetical protein